MVARIARKQKPLAPMGLNFNSAFPLICLECGLPIDPPQLSCPSCRTEVPELVINAQAQCVRGSNE
jgi:hypothetical protein